MPELPEVEVTRLGLSPAVMGAVVQRVVLGKPLRWPLGADPAQAVGLRLSAPLRRGKYLWFGLEDALSGEPRGGWLVHLGMSGSLRWWPEDAQDAGQGPHDHFVCRTDRGVLVLTDPRRFGAVVWSPALNEAPAARMLQGLGREPLEPGWDGRWLHAQWQGRRAPVKAALLAGDVLVGVGNIYCSEALFLAGIDPRTPAGELGVRRCERLAQAVRAVLAQAIELGGSTLRDFKSAHGVNGDFQHEARVYGREGEPCRVCGSLIRRIVQGQRATYLCSRCQRR